MWTVDAIDIARSLGDRDELRAAIQEAEGRRKTRLAKAPLIVQLMEELKDRLKAGTSLSPATARSRSRRSTPKPRPRHTPRDR